MQIRELQIKRFRGVRELVWRPSPGLNVLIGPADAGKSTLLAAIALLLAPGQKYGSTEFDYYNRAVGDEFEIRAVLGELSDELMASERALPLMGLRGDAVVDVAEGKDEPVLVARVRGTEELELIYELVGPEEVTYPFRPSLRQKFMLADLSTDERSSRELKMGYGSLLERTIGRTDVRAALTKAVGDVDVEVPAATSAKVSALASEFEQSGLPAELLLGIIAPHGGSLMGLLGLLVGSSKAEAIPIGHAGAGTRNLALFTLAAALLDGAPIAVLDEPERGLEPYRQRTLINRVRKLIGSSGQAFISTHSPAVLDELSEAELWRLREDTVEALKHVAESQVWRPARDALLCPLPVVCEGVTEVGFLRSVFGHYAEREGSGLDALGVRLVDGRGQPQAIDAAGCAIDDGVPVGAFLDREATHGGRREELGKRAGCVLFEWAEVTCLEEALARYLDWEALPELVELVAKQRRSRREGLLQQVSTELGAEGVAELASLKTTYSEEAIRAAIGARMKSHRWLKTLDCGEAVGRWAVERGLPDALDVQIKTFWDRLRALSNG